MNTSTTASNSLFSRTWGGIADRCVHNLEHRWKQLKNAVYDAPLKKVGDRAIIKTYVTFDEQMSDGTRNYLGFMKDFGDAVSFPVMALNIAAMNPITAAAFDASIALLLVTTRRFASKSMADRVLTSRHSGPESQPARQKDVFPGHMTLQDRYFHIEREISAMQQVGEIFQLARDKIPLIQSYFQQTQGFTPEACSQFAWTALYAQKDYKSNLIVGNLKKKMDELLKSMDRAMDNLQNCPSTPLRDKQLQKIGDALQTVLPFSDMMFHDDEKTSYRQDLLDRQHSIQAMMQPVALNASVAQASTAPTVSATPAAPQSIRRRTP